MKDESLLLPNRQHEKLTLMKIKYRNSSNPIQKIKLANSIQGREAQAKQIRQYKKIN